MDDLEIATTSEYAPDRGASTNLPVQLVRLLQFADIKRAALSDELDVARARRRVLKRDEHHVGEIDRKSTRLNSSHSGKSRMPSSA